MANPKTPVPPRRRGGPDPFGHRPGAPLNREASYAPPHTFGNPGADEPAATDDASLEDAALEPDTSFGSDVVSSRLLDADPIGAASLGSTPIGGAPLPIAPEPVPPTDPTGTTNETARQIGQPDNLVPMYRAENAQTEARSVGAQVVIPRETPVPVHETQDGQQHYVASPLVVTDQPVTVARSLPPATKQVVLVQIASLVAAFEEVEGYEVRRQHNQRRPALWVDDKQYLQDVKALLNELRRLNDLLEQAKAPDAAKVEESGGAVAHAAKRISDGAYDTIGKGLGYVILGSVGTILYQLGVGGELGQMVMSTIKGGR